MDLFSFNKHKEESKITSNLPHRQLFKPENWIESVFVCLSICSVVVVILSNIVNIDSSLKFLVPHFIAENFRQIMHIAHIILIVYVLIAMQNIYENIRKIDKHKDEIKKRIDKKDEALLKRWQLWIKENINISKEKKKDYTESPDEISRFLINKNIFIANSNLKAFYILWLCVWGTWLLMYVSMLFVGFIDKVIKDPDAGKYPVRIENKNSGKFVYPILDTNKTDFYVHPQSEYQISFFYWSIDDKIASSDYLIYIKHDTLNYRIISDTTLIINAQLLNKLDKEERKVLWKTNEDSIVLLTNAVSFINSSNDSNFFLSEKLPAIQVRKVEHTIQPVMLDSVNFVLSEQSYKETVKNVLVFVENLTGFVVNLFFFLLFYIVSYQYVSRNTYKNIEKEYKIVFRKRKNYRKTIESMKKYNHRFRKVLIISIAITLAFIAVDIPCSLGSREEFKFYTQSIVSVVGCISMLFLFGQMNNGNLRLPPVATAVMYFYAAVQLFAPFRGAWVISEQYILPDTLGFLVTTLCFVAKFMVFFIIRWLFAEGRLAYFFIDAAFNWEDSPKYEELFGEKKHNAFHG